PTPRARAGARSAPRARRDDAPRADRGAPGRHRRRRAPAGAARAAVLARAGVSRRARQRGRCALREGPPRPRRECARLPPGAVPPPAGLRAARHARGRRVRRASPPQGPSGAGGRRVRRHRRPGHHGGPARGAVRRDPRRVRRSGGDVTTLVLALALVPLLALRALAAAAEVMLANAPARPPRRWPPPEAVLAATARATAHLAGAASVGIVATLVWRSAGRAWVVPHVDVCGVPDTASVAEVVALVQERGFSRLPVFHERMFNTLGVVSSLDLLGGMDPHLPVTAVMREPLFVPESKTLPELL